MAVIGMRNPPAVDYPAQRKSGSSAKRSQSADAVAQCVAKLRCSRAMAPGRPRTRENQASLVPKSKLGGFNARFAVSTAYQTQLQLLSVSHEVRFKAL